MHEEYLNEERSTADLCCPQWNSWLIFVYPPTWIFFQIRLHHQILVHKRIQLSRAQLNPVESSHVFFCALILFFFFFSFFFFFTIQWQDLWRNSGRLIGCAILRRRDPSGGAGKVHWITAGIFSRLWHWNLGLLRYGRLIGVGAIIKPLIMN